MHTNFSLQRIKLLLLADKTELFRQYFLSMLSYIAFVIAYLVITKLLFHNEHEAEQKIVLFHTLGVFLYFFFFCRFVNQKVHQVKGQYLTIPASTVEKYIALLIEVTILLLFFHLLYHISIYFISLLISDFPAMGVNNILDKIPVSCYFFLASTLFLSNITFRKYADLIVIVSYSFLAFAFGILARPILRAVREPQGDVCMIETTPLYYLYNFLIQYHGIILYAATLVVLYISYLKLKEKQIR